MQHAFGQAEGEVGIVARPHSDSRTAGPRRCSPAARADVTVSRLALATSRVAHQRAESTVARSAATSTSCQGEERRRRVPHGVDGSRASCDWRFGHRYGSATAAPGAASATRSGTGRPPRRSGSRARARLRGNGSRRASPQARHAAPRCVCVRLFSSTTSPRPQLRQEPVLVQQLRPGA